MLIYFCLFRVVLFRKEEIMKLYVGGIPFAYCDQDLREAFEPYGPVDSATVVSDRRSGRSRGFGFVEMTTDEGGQAAITKLNGQELGGRIIKVEQSVKLPESDRSS
jgi:RNA recognition motif-containing protein